MIPITTIMYYGTVVIIVLLLLLFVQIYKRRDPIANEITRRNNITVDTPKGLVRADRQKIAEELKKVRDKIISKKSSIDGNCHEINYLIKKSITNLDKFIKENPGRDGVLCRLELRNDIVYQSMEDSINPHPLVWEEKYKTILEHEEDEREMKVDPVKRLVYLIKNIDIVIRMLRYDICDYGRIDLTKLYKILSGINQKICKTKPMYIATNNIDFEYKKPTLPNNKIKYRKNQNSTIVEDSVENIHRSKPKLESFGSISDTSFGNPNFKSTINSSVGDSYTNAFNKVYNQTHDFGYDHVREDTNNLEINENVHNYDYTIGQVTALTYAKKLYDTKSGSTLLDRSIEGSVERDILGYKQPGHIISQLYDRSDHYTTNVNSCLGKTVSDDDLWSKCTKYDMSARLALEGDTQYLISNLNESYHL
jgi:hypothetical protein